MKLAELDSELEKNQLSGFWRTRVPLHSSEVPSLWKWEPLLDGLLKASETIGIEQAERRAIRLVSPHLPVKSTSHTLQFTFSIVNPGEVARAHRHNMAAIRFVVQGKGAYTAVAGEKFPMEEGDLILTPNRTWHDHHNESQDPIIWLDGLDGPLIQSLNVLFFEDSDVPEQPITRAPGKSKRAIFAGPRFCRSCMFWPCRRIWRIDIQSCRRNSFAFFPGRSAGRSIGGARFRVSSKPGRMPISTKSDGFLTAIHGPTAWKRIGMC